MNLSRTHLGDGACSTLRLKIDGCNHTGAMTTLGCRCEVDGYEWEICLFYPWRFFSGDHRIALTLVFLSDAGANRVRVALSCRLVDPTGSIDHRQQRPLRLRHIMVPSPNLPKHLGELLESKVGADVTFPVSGKSLAAHKNVLAARSPVFMAEFFGEMQEKSSGRVKIRGMEPSVFGAMLRFIYTDAVPELDRMETATANLAQHLVVAADRYQLDRLKVLCEQRLAFAIDNIMLALAEQQGCSQLKVKCMEFIAGGSSENLDTVMKTEGFKDLMANSPTMMAELLVAAHGRKK
uniref:BTB domain-containing protein n=1 Tax=Setaria italica TaxID=4555 RepID=K3ZEX4_SETIT